MSPMVDGWMGDDWFHYGAFRQTELRLLHRPDHRSAAQAKASSARPTTTTTSSCSAGSAGDFAKAARAGPALSWWKKVSEHPAYDAFWQEQALDKIMAEAAAEGADHVDPGPVGPGRHVGRAPRATPPSSPRTPTTTRTSWCWPLAPQPGQLRRLQRWASSSGTATPPCSSAATCCKPFFDQYLKDGAPKADTPPVLHLRYRARTTGIATSAGRRAANEGRCTLELELAAWPSARLRRRPRARGGL